MLRFKKALKMSRVQYKTHEIHKKKLNYIHNINYGMTIKIKSG